jgi:large subunit ribosomal protein L29
LASNQEKKEMKATELRQKDVAGLQTEVKELQKAHFGLRMQKATQQLNNTATLRIARRDIARAKTILVEKQSAETATSKATPSVAAK